MAAKYEFNILEIEKAMKIYKQRIYEVILEISNKNPIVADYRYPAFKFNESTQELQVQCNIKEIVRNFDNICATNVIGYEGIFKGNVKVVRSTRSYYLLEEDIQGFENIFPSFERERDLLDIETGHMTHFTRLDLTSDHIAKLLF